MKIKFVELNHKYKFGIHKKIITQKQISLIKTFVTPTLRITIGGRALLLSSVRKLNMYSIHIKYHQRIAKKGRKTNSGQIDHRHY